MSLSLRNLNLVQWLQCSLSGIDRPKWESAATSYILAYIVVPRGRSQTGLTS